MPNRPPLSRAGWESARGVLLGLAVAAACSVPDQLESPTTGARNVCAVDEECGAQGTCDHGTCLSTTLELGTLVFRVTPASLSGTPVAPYLLRNLPPISRQRNELDGTSALRLPPLVTTAFGVSFTIAAQKSHPCWKLLAGLTPASVTMSPVDPSRPAGGDAPLDRALGLPIPKITDDRLDDRNRVIVTAQNGTYDLYVRPTGGDPACPIPPFLLRDYVTELTTFDLSLGDPERLKGTILGPPATSFASWRVEVVDAETGLAVSTVGGVLPPDAGGGSAFGLLDATGSFIVGPVEYYPPAVRPGGKPAPYYIRLAPPSGTLSPTFAWDATLANPVSGKDATLDLTGFQPATVTVDARLETGATPPVGVSGTVWVHSLGQPISGSLTGVPKGILAAFSGSVEASSTKDNRGRAFVPLVPGRYDVVGVSDLDSSLGLTRTTWDIPNTQAIVGGIVLPLPPRPALEVRVLALADQPAFNAPLEAAAEPAVSNPFDGVFRRIPIAPRGDASLTGADGSSRLLVDAAIHDLTVRFDARTGFPWIVAPRVSVSQGGRLDLRVVLPIELRGRVLTPETPGASEGGDPAPLVGGALTAYALLPPVTTGTPRPARFLPVGEAAIDSVGRFRLLLPARLSGATLQ